MKFNIVVRGVIMKQGKVLLAHQVGADNTFLPGGHIELGEGAEAALTREILEETGHKGETKGFIGVVENPFVSNSIHRHEINLIFEADIPGLDPGKPVRSCEDHIEFIWADVSELKTHNLLPVPMIECVAGLCEGASTFWGTTFWG